MKEGLISQLRWTKPGTPSPPGRAAALPPQPRQRTATGRALELYGVPRAPYPHDQSALTEARYLLKASAEIEHGLLIQYLYAAYSLNLSLPGPADWALTIRNIAVQEMDHLINVQNMLLLVNESAYFDRANFPVPPAHTGYYPFGYRLEPFTGDSLSKYVSAESPLPETVSDPVLRSKLEQIIARAEKATGMTTFGHVGTLYAYIYWLFLPSDDAQGPWPNFPADWFRCLTGWHISPSELALASQLDPVQADFLEFKANNGNDPGYPHNDNGNHRWVFRVRTAQDALLAISQIAVQGEGLEYATDSHFLEFLGIYDALVTSPPSGDIHLNVPTSPNLGNDPATAGGRITNRATKLWALLCNTRYLMLLQELPLALAQHRDQPGQNTTRQALITDAIRKEMLMGIGYFARRLTTLPRAADAKDFAGMPFELPDAPLPRTTNDQWQELVRLIGVTRSLLTQLRGLTGSEKPNAMDETTFQSLEAADNAILQIVPPPFHPKENSMTAQQLNSFSDVQAFMNKFISDNGSDLSGSPHGAFWNPPMDYNSFVNGNVPGVQPNVKILVKGDAEHSNLILILRGSITVGAKMFERMPADGSPFMSDALIAVLADWINRNCPN